LINESEPDYKASSPRPRAKPVVKRIRSISGKLYVLLDPQLVKHFGSSISEETFLEESIVDNGILLRPYNKFSEALVPL
jgi:hypothetical protein